MLNGRLDYIKSVLFWMSCSSNYGDYSEEEYQEFIKEYDRLVKENLGGQGFL